MAAVALSLNWAILGETTPFIFAAVSCVILGIDFFMTGGKNLLIDVFGSCLVDKKLAQLSQPILASRYLLQPFIQFLWPLKKESERNPF